MTVDSKARRSVYSWLAMACVVALVLTGALWWIFRDPGGTKVSAYFGRTVGLYAGSSVRVLGIKVGEITAVTPAGDQVRVDMNVDAGVSIPADAGAVVVAPSLVSDRYVQLTPPTTPGRSSRPAPCSAATAPRCPPNWTTSTAA